MDAEPARRCPECSAALEFWDHSSSGFFAGLGTVVLACVGFGIASLVGYAAGEITGMLVGIALWLLAYAVIKAFATNREATAFFQCSGCGKKFTGPDLKPFEWSDYTGW